MNIMMGIHYHMILRILAGRDIGQFGREGRSARGIS